MIFLTFVVIISCIGIMFNIHSLYEFRKLLNWTLGGSIYLLFESIAAVINGCIFLLLRDKNGSMRRGVTGGLLGSIIFILLVCFSIFISKWVFYQGIGNTLRLFVCAVVTGTMLGVFGGACIGHFWKGAIGSVIISIISYLTIFLLANITWA